MQLDYEPIKLNSTQNVQECDARNDARGAESLKTKTLTDKTSIMEPEYPIHILTIKLWEWEGIREKWDTDIKKHGPHQQTCEWHDEAVMRINELKGAIEKLKK